MDTKEWYMHAMLVVAALSLVVAIITIVFKIYEYRRDASIRCQNEENERTQNERNRVNILIENFTAQINELNGLYNTLEDNTPSQRTPTYNRSELLHRNLASLIGEFRNLGLAIQDVGFMDFLKRTETLVDPRPLDDPNRISVLERIKLNFEQYNNILQSVINYRDNL